MLRGDGQGHFSAVPPSESGLIVPGDAKALVVLDLNDDGWPDFLVSRNFNTTLAFRNTGAVGRHPLAVRLRGKPGNPTAIGAQVTLELADGAKQVAEICAGSGYTSQSSAACWFGHVAENPPRFLQVRWPDGINTQHAVPLNAEKMVLSRDER